MANIKISELTPKGANLASTDLLEISESAGGGTYVTKSITGAQIVAAAGGVTSVSGTAPIASTGGTTPTISIATANTSTTGALTSTDWNTFNGKQNALTLTTTGTSGAATLVGSTLNIPQYSGGSGGGNVGIHALLPLASGQTVTAAINAISITPTTTVLNRLYANVFIPNQNITTSSLRINCATAAAGGLAKIFIYSDNNGSPDSLLYGSSDLDLSTTGIKTATTTFNFVAGTRYWIGAHLNNATSQLSFLAIGQLTPLYNTTISTSAGIVVATVNYASGLPSTFPSPTFGTSGAPVIGITKA